MAAIIKHDMCQGLDKKLSDSLKNIGILTVIDYVSADLGQVAEKTGKSYKELDEIRGALFAEYTCYPTSGAEVFQDYKSRNTVLPSRCTALDQLLDGGVYTGEVTEIVGPLASGKTQFCMSLALSLALKAQSHVYLIDTRGGFSPRRLHQMMRSQPASESDITAAMSRILCVEAYDIFELMNRLEDLENSLKESSTDSFFHLVKLVVIDSVTAVVSPILGSQHLQGQVFMMRLGKVLQTLASERAISVLTTNGTVHGDRGHPKVALGRSWLHVPHTRVLLSCDKSEADLGTVCKLPLQRKATLLKSPRRPSNIYTTFHIEDKGISDVPTKR